MPEVICAYCGKQLHRRPVQIRLNKTGLYFCNIYEKGIYWKEHGFSSQEQIGKGNRLVRLRVNGITYGEKMAGGPEKPAEQAASTGKGFGVF
jgi:hypothetical protein